VSTAFPRPSNPPEQPTLSYRIGTRSGFLKWMLEQLPWQTIPDGQHAGARPLANLATHSARDPAVALLDAFAVVADVLTFYGERIVNEGFLRTSTETRSVMEMARALGYELPPGVAASTWLVFTVEQAAGAPPQVIIDPGVRVLSVPGQNERPQTFETVERIIARPEWNTLRPITVVPQPFTEDAAELWVGIAQANLSSGDQLLFVSHDRETNETSTRWDLRTVLGVTLYPASGRAKVTLVPNGGSDLPLSSGGRVYLMSLKAGAFGNNAPDYQAMPDNIKNAAKFKDPANPNEWKDFALTGSSLYLDNLYSKLLPGTWMVLRESANTKLCWVDTVQIVGYANFTLTARSTVAELKGKAGGNAASVTAFTRRGVLVLGQGDELRLVDRLLVNDHWGTAILAPFPDVDPSLSNPFDKEDQVALDGVVPGLHPDRTIMVTGKRLRARVDASLGIRLLADNGVTVPYAKGEVLFVVSRPEPAENNQTRWRLIDAGGFEGSADLVPSDVALEPAEANDPFIAEVMTIAAVVQTPIRTTLQLTAPLKYWYDRATVTLSGNVAIATHGETVAEALGSGDGSQANQRFTLKRSPLTWVSAATSTGRLSTLEIRVDGVLWHEALSFHDQALNARVYLTQQDEQGRTTVVFGDGIHGARLPSGLENVVARYRIGTGLAGEVGSGKIMLFQTRPLGLRAVTNPLSAVGAEDPATGATAKTDVPESVLTLDRVVSITDYKTFAHTFAGIGKARAAFLRKGEAQRVHLTLALADGMPTPADSPILGYLRSALDAVRDTTTLVEMAGHRRQWFRLAAKLRIKHGFLFDNVKAAASEAMTKAFSFDRRAFGQDVSAAEIVALLQGVPGVEAVDLDGLETKGSLNDQTQPSTVSALLEADEAHVNSNDEMMPAELLLLDPSPYGLTFKNAAEVQP
jgi:hypothetical protein